MTFVSVTQSFNTTTSMGRLMLNILLSFAQFEREVTAERIRDKIAASRRKGMWMGGNVPWGYEVRDRKLVVNEAEAAVVRSIFERFIATGSATVLARELRREGVRSNRGSVIHKGVLYRLLSNRVYIGEAVHKGTAYRTSPRARSWQTSASRSFGERWSGWIGFGICMGERWSMQKRATSRSDVPEQHCGDVRKRAKPGQVCAAILGRGSGATVVRRFGGSARQHHIGRRRTSGTSGRKVRRAIVSA